MKQCDFYTTPHFVWSLLTETTDPVTKERRRGASNELLRGDGVNDSSQSKFLEISTWLGDFPIKRSMRLKRPCAPYVNPEIR